MLTLSIQDYMKQKIQGDKELNRDILRNGIKSLVKISKEVSTILN